MIRNNFQSFTIHIAMIQTVLFDTKPYDREPLQRASAGLDIEWRFMIQQKFRLSSQSPAMGEVIEL